MVYSIFNLSSFNLSTAHNPQNIKQKLKTLNFIKTTKKAPLIRMSLVLVRLSRPKSAKLFMYLLDYTKRFDAVRKVRKKHKWFN